MKIQSLQLKNFKRFTDLTLQDIPENAKLVLLIGSNGSGKSALFDAFEMINSRLLNEPFEDSSYHKKDINQPFEIKFRADNSEEEQYVTSKNSQVVTTNNRFYGRTSFRNVSRLERKRLGYTELNFERDQDRPKASIDSDERFENDIEIFLGEILREVFKTNVSTMEIREKYIAPLNESLNRILQKTNGTKLSITEFIPPIEGSPFDIKFIKGNSIISYDLLSAGEKSLIILLLNLQSRQAYLKNSIIFIDEADIHLNTAIQISLLKEIIEHWIPDNCQFWTASHSLGFIQYAKESEEAVIFDFDDYDFDYPKILTPEPKDNPEIYEIAVNKDILPSLFKDYTIFFVENKDKNFYSALNIPHILFVQANDKKSVYHKAKSGQFNGIIDRDFLTDDDIKEIEKQYTKLKILRFYSIENYLYHPNNLEEYYQSNKISFHKEAYIKNLENEKDIVKDEIKRKLAMVRMSYPFFEEPEHSGKSNQNRFRSGGENLAQVQELEQYLNSPDFNLFYKIFPMKDYATQLKERQGIDRTDLSKTAWFKQQIEQIINQK
jgi:predicted ATP-binding protein involved in virulence